MISVYIKFPFGVTVKRIDNISMRPDWCEKNIGEEGVAWVIDGLIKSPQIVSALIHYRFADEKHATFFTLRWA